MFTPSLLLLSIFVTNEGKRFCFWIKFPVLRSLQPCSLRMLSFFFFGSSYLVICVRVGVSAKLGEASVNLRRNNTAPFTFKLLSSLLPFQKSRKQWLGEMASFASLTSQING